VANAERAEALLGTKASFLRQGLTLGENADGGDPQGEDPGGGDKMSGVNVPLTAIQKQEKKRLQQEQRSPSYSDKSKRVGDNHDNRDCTARHLQKLSKP